MATNGWITIALSGGVPVIALVGDFDLSNRNDLSSALRAVSDGDGRQVALNLSETTSLDVAILAVLAGAWRQGTQLSVRGASGEARVALEMSGLLCHLREDA